jgi:HSP20 family protein
MALFRTTRRELDPANALFQLQAELDRVFRNPYGWDPGLSGPGVFPPVNVFKDGDDVVIRFEVPGFAPEDLTIENRGQTLQVSGKRTDTPAEGGYHRREREAREFARAVQLPREVDASQATANCKHGVLTVRVPAKAETKPRQIAVQNA